MQIYLQVESNIFAKRLKPCFNALMEKNHAINLLGGTIRLAAESVGITVQAVSAWPDVLPSTIADRVEAAYHRKTGRRIPAAQVGVKAD